MERVIYGMPFAEALAQEIERIGAHAVYVLASGTLARQTDVIDQVRGVLGNRLAGVCAKIGAHTPRIDVVAAANAAREARADALLTVGGGSVTDAAKMVGLCLGNDVTRSGAARRVPRRASMPTAAPSVRRSKPPAVRSIAVPTTLSAGEFNSFAGCTDTVRHVKESYAPSADDAAQRDPGPRRRPCTRRNGCSSPPASARSIMRWRTSARSIRSRCPTAPRMHALRLLGRGLRAVKADPGDLEARLDCQLGAWMSIMGSQNGVPKGASHGIGHVLGGTAGVPHGYTSCVMLPHGAALQRAVNAERQAWVSEALGRPGMPAADAVAELIADLGLPGTLRDVGVKAEQLDRIAEESMHDRWVHTNPRKIDGPGGCARTARRGLVNRVSPRSVCSTARSARRGGTACAGPTTSGFSWNFATPSASRR